MKKVNKFLLILSFLCIIGSISLIPFNLYVVKLPEYMTIIAAAFTCLCVLGYCATRPGKAVLKFILPLIGLFSVIITIFGAYCNPYWNSMSMKKQVQNTAHYSEELSFELAKKDLDYMMKYLTKNHPAFLRDKTDMVQKTYEGILKELKTADTIPVTLLRQKAAEILSGLGDAHTSVYSRYSQPRYLKTTAARKADNWELAKINGTSVKTLFENKKHLFSYEVEAWGFTQMCDQLLTLEGLAYLGFDISSPIAYVYRNDAGDEETDIYTVDDFVIYEDYLKINERYLKGKTNKSFVNYQMDEEKSLAVFTLTSCRYNDEFRICVDNMFSEIKKKNIQNIAVDLRENSGGNSLVINYFLRYLDIDQYYVPTSKWRMGPFLIPLGNNTVKNDKKTDLLFRGNLYLFTSTGSFSSTMMFAQCVKDNALGTIIGEIPGNTTNGFGDIAVFSLPNSKLYFQVSTKKFYRANPNTTENLVRPDIFCPKNRVFETLYDIL